VTLCIAWIRQNGAEQELVMATDSRLTGGEMWDSGVKLFELPRQDCLLCFAGGTARAYPLILNSITSIKLDKHLSSPYTDIHIILEYLTELFSSLVSGIKNAAEGLDEARAAAEFIFAGWSWKYQQFRIWQLYYNPALKAFTHNVISPSDPRAIIFLGDHQEEARALFEQRLRESDKLFSGAYDMEPLQVLVEMARNDEIYPIGGALQIAKIYRSGTSEFFGIMWPSATGGSPYFLGREMHIHDLPGVHVFDPDTTEVMDDELPLHLTVIDETIFGSESNFVVDCYPGNRLKNNLSEKVRKRLLEVMRSVAFKKFVEDMIALEAKNV
jgi:hypothetical protein